MASTREIKRRITSVKNTRQITKAMKMVAAAKLRRAQDAVVQARPYATKMREVVGSLGASFGGESHPLLARRNEKNVLVLLFSSDKGLCGAFNSNLFKAVLKIMEENEGKDVHLSSIGKKGRDYFRRRKVTMEKAYVDFSRNVNYPFAASIAKDVIEMYTSGKVDKVYIVYNKFRTVIAQDVTVAQLVPVSLEAGANAEEKPEGLYEPSAASVLDAIVEQYVEVQVYQALLESWASENGSRMAAMDSASRNAGDMINRLTLIYNRARQSAITKELIEIVSGADALKG
ncbi:MAG: ATP synthase F1 subunit gamma [Nitrospinae bacterium]|nr:ATP synthase F1 subunit gamma [Nitrospinota bacterium]